MDFKSMFSVVFIRKIGGEGIILYLFFLRTLVYVCCLVTKFKVTFFILSIKDYQHLKLFSLMIALYSEIIIEKRELLFVLVIHISSYLLLLLVLVCV